ncbi:Transmembrane channel-like protein like protein [Aduncisulcus paluster]|uniref:Transmembrane channel-like protein like protein n=1 Tax=Aduncisulcus paluster TaxID=2918883 RepID=A0ABQ5K276_9EUKA|nr:Transmembrane channel-like protein like protein [Aduncisulcus paluster]
MKQVTPQFLSIPVRQIISSQPPKPSSIPVDVQSDDNVYDTNGYVIGGQDSHREAISKDIQAFGVVVKEEAVKDEIEPPPVSSHLSVGSVPESSRLQPEKEDGGAIKEESVADPSDDIQINPTVLRAQQKAEKEALEEMAAANKEGFIASPRNMRPTVLSVDSERDISREVPDDNALVLNKKILGHLEELQRITTNSLSEREYMTAAEIRIFQGKVLPFSSSDRRKYGSYMQKLIAGFHPGLLLQKMNADSDEQDLCCKPTCCTNSETLKDKWDSVKRMKEQSGRTSDVNPLWRDSIRKIRGRFGAGEGALFEFIRGVFEDSALFYAPLLPEYEYSYDLYNSNVYHMDLGYTLTFCVSLYKPKGNKNSAQGLGKHTAFSSALFSFWDHSKQDPLGVQDSHIAFTTKISELVKKRKILKKELAEMNAKKGSIGPMFQYFFRAFIGLALTSGICFGFVLALVFLKRFEADSEDGTGLWYIPMIVSGMNTISPLLVRAIIRSVEPWKYASTRLVHTVVRVTLVKAIILGTMCISMMDLFTGDICPYTSAGQDLWLLMWIDLIMQLSLSLIVPGFLSLFACFKPYPLKVEVIAVDMLYRQCIMFLGMVASPGVVVMACVTNFIVFYVRKWEALFFCRREDKPWGVESLNRFLVGACAIVFVSMLLVLFWVMQKEVTICGAQQDYGSMVGVIMHYSESVTLPGASLSRVLSIAFHPGILGILALIMILLLFFALGSLRTTKTALKRQVMVSDTMRIELRDVTKAKRSMERVMNDLLDPSNPDGVGSPRSPRQAAPGVPILDLPGGMGTPRDIKLSRLMNEWKSEGKYADTQAQCTSCKFLGVWELRFSSDGYLTHTGSDDSSVYGLCHDFFPVDHGDDGFIEGTDFTHMQTMTRKWKYHPTQTVVRVWLDYEYNVYEAINNGGNDWSKGDEIIGTWTGVYNQGFEMNLSLTLTFDDAETSTTGNFSVYGFSAYARPASTEVMYDKDGNVIDPSDIAVTYKYFSFCAGTMSGWAKNLDLNSVGSFTNPDTLCYTGTLVAPRPTDGCLQDNTEEPVSEAPENSDDIPVFTNYEDYAKYINSLNLNYKLHEHEPNVTFRKNSGSPRNVFGNSVGFEGTSSVKSSWEGKGIDWRNKDNKNYVGPARDQGQCGSCYSFASAGLMKAMYCIEHEESQDGTECVYDLDNRTVEDEFRMAPTPMLECSPLGQGCDGGFSYLMGRYGRDFGWVREDKWPYPMDADDNVTLDTCDLDRFQGDDYDRYFAGTYGYIGGAFGACTEDLMTDYLDQHGPLAIGVMVNRDPNSGCALQVVESGIYDGSASKYARLERGDNGPDNFVETDHAVLLVGYGHDDDTDLDYWIIRNSWGEGIGDNGFINVQRGLCAVDSMAVRVETINRTHIINFIFGILGLLILSVDCILYTYLCVDNSSNHALKHITRQRSKELEKRVNFVNEGEDDNNNASNPSSAIAIAQKFLAKKLGGDDDTSAGMPGGMEIMKHGYTHKTVGVGAFMWKMSHYFTYSRKNGRFDVICTITIILFCFLTHVLNNMNGVVIIAIFVVSMCCVTLYYTISTPHFSLFATVSTTFLLSTLIGIGLASICCIGDIKHSTSSSASNTLLGVYSDNSSTYIALYFIIPSITGVVWSGVVFLKVVLCNKSFISRLKFVLSHDENDPFLDLSKQSWCEDDSSEEEDSSESESNEESDSEEEEEGEEEEEEESTGQGEEDFTKGSLRGVIPRQIVQSSSIQDLHKGILSGSPSHKRSQSAREKKSVGFAITTTDVKSGNTIHSYQPTTSLTDLSPTSQGLSSVFNIPSSLARRSFEADFGKEVEHIHSDKGEDKASDDQEKEAELIGSDSPDDGSSSQRAELSDSIKIHVDDLGREKEQDPSPFVKQIKPIRPTISFPSDFSIPHLAFNSSLLSPSNSRLESPAKPEPYEQDPSPFVKQIKPIRPTISFPSDFSIPHLAFNSSLLSPSNSRLESPAKPEPYVTPSGRFYASGRNTDFDDLYPKGSLLEGCATRQPSSQYVQRSFSPLFKSVWALEFYLRVLIRRMGFLSTKKHILLDETEDENTELRALTSLVAAFMLTGIDNENLRNNPSFLTMWMLFERDFRPQSVGRVQKNAELCMNHMPNDARAVFVQALMDASVNNFASIGGRRKKRMRYTRRVFPAIFRLLSELEKLWTFMYVAKVIEEESTRGQMRMMSMNVSTSQLGQQASTPRIYQFSLPPSPKASALSPGQSTTTQPPSNISASMVQGDVAMQSARVDPSGHLTPSYLRQSTSRSMLYSANSVSSTDSSKNVTSNKFIRRYYSEFTSRLREVSKQMRRLDEVFDVLLNPATKDSVTLYANVCKSILGNRGLAEYYMDIASTMKEHEERHVLARPTISELWKMVSVADDGIEERTHTFLNTFLQDLFDKASKNKKKRSQYKEMMNAIPPPGEGRKKIGQMYGLRLLGSILPMIGFVLISAAVIIVLALILNVLGGIQETVDLISVTTNTLSSLHTFTSSLFQLPLTRNLDVVASLAQSVWSGTESMFFSNVSDRTDELFLTNYEVLEGASDASDLSISEIMSEGDSVVRRSLPTDELEMYMHSGVDEYLFVTVDDDELADLDSEATMFDMDSLPDSLQPLLTSSVSLIRAMSLCNIAAQSLTSDFPTATYFPIVSSQTTIPDPDETLEMSQTLSGYGEWRTLVSMIPFSVKNALETSLNSLYTHWDQYNNLLNIWVVVLLLVGVIWSTFCIIVFFVFPTTKIERKTHSISSLFFNIGSRAYLQSLYNLHIRKIVFSKEKRASSRVSKIEEKPKTHKEIKTLTDLKLKDAVNREKQKLKKERERRMRAATLRRHTSISSSNVSDDDSSVACVEDLDDEEENTFALHSKASIIRFWLPYHIWVPLVTIIIVVILFMEIPIVITNCRAVSLASTTQAQFSNAKSISTMLLFAEVGAVSEYDSQLLRDEMLDQLNSIYADIKQSREELLEGSIIDPLPSISPVMNKLFYSAQCYRYTSCTDSEASLSLINHIDKTLNAIETLSALETNAPYTTTPDVTAFTKTLNNTLPFDTEAGIMMVVDEAEQILDSNMASMVFYCILGIVLALICVLILSLIEHKKMYARFSDKRDFTLLFWSGIMMVVDEAEQILDSNMASMVFYCILGIVLALICVLILSLIEHKKMYARFSDKRDFTLLFWCMLPMEEISEPVLQLTCAYLNQAANNIER